MKRLLISILFLVSACTSLATPPIPSATPTFSPSPTATSTITSTPTPRVVTATPTLFIPTAVQDFYTVQTGDTLGSIAYRFGMDVYDLASANNLKNIDLIFVNQVLLIASPKPDVAPTPDIKDGKEIIVDISMQKAFAFEDGKLLKTFIVATGLSAFPTVIGPYQVQSKYEDAPMSGPGYYLPHVPWIMYFHKGYALHGAPWNNNLGTPGSHGCVNMSVEDAHWLFDWTPLGTKVLTIP